MNNDNEVTDNSKIDKYPGCKNCMLKAVGENGYRKCECMRYKYPSQKPYELLYGKEKCKYLLD